MRSSMVGSSPNSSWRWMKSAWHVMVFGVTRRLIFALLVAIVVLLSLFAAAVWQGPNFDPAWTLGDRVLTCATLAVAIAVWFGEIRQDWDNQLPRRLNVFFLFEGQPILVCRGAFLPGEHDVRALGQQIGMQMAGGKPLTFDASTVRFTRLSNVVSWHAAHAQFEVVFELMSCPQLPEASRPPKGHCVVWKVDRQGRRSALTALQSEAWCRPEAHVIHTTSVSVESSDEHAATLART